jgi:hypothetical protein
MLGVEFVCSSGILMNLGTSGPRVTGPASDNRGGVQDVNVAPFVTAEAICGHTMLQTVESFGVTIIKGAVRRVDRRAQSAPEVAREIETQWSGCVRSRQATQQVPSVN